MKRAWLIYFDDADMKPEIFSGDDDGRAARVRFEEVQTNWNVTLFFSDEVVNEIARTAQELGKRLAKLEAR